MNISLKINGLAREAKPGERLLELMNRVGVAGAACLLSSPTRSDPNLRHMPGGGRWRAGARLRDRAAPAWRFAPTPRGRGRRSAKPSTGSLATTCSIARSATTTTATARFTTRPSCWPSSIRNSRSTPKPYEVDATNPFYRYDPASAFCAGAAWRPARTCRSTKRSRSAGRTRTRACCGTAARPIGESSCVSCGHCVTVCPCNALMEKSMLGQAGFLTGLPKTALDGMIDVVKGVEPETGYGAIMKVSEVEAAMREIAHPPHQNGVHVLRGRLQLRHLDQGPPHPEGRAGRRPGQRHLHVRQRQVRLGFRQQPGPADQAADPRERAASARPRGTRRWT